MINTFNALVRRLQVRHEISLTRVYFDEISYCDVAGLPGGTQAVKVDHDVLWTAYVEFSTDTSA